MSLHDLRCGCSLLQREFILGVFLSVMGLEEQKVTHLETYVTSNYFTEKSSAEMMLQCLMWKKWEGSVCLGQKPTMDTSFDLI